MLQQIYWQFISSKKKQKQTEQVKYSTIVIFIAWGLKKKFRLPASETSFKIYNKKQI